MSAPISLSTTLSLPDVFAMLSSAFGAALIGSWIAMVLYGLALVQTYIYFLAYPGDALWIKLLVYILWILNTLHVIFTAHAVYQYLVTNAFNISAMVSTSWSLTAIVATRYVIHCGVLIYLAKLCLDLSSKRGRWWLVTVLTVPITASFAFGIDIIVRMSLSKQLTDYTKFVDSTAIPTLMLQVICEIMLTVTLCIILGKHKSAFKRTNTMINTVMVYALNRGMLMVLATIAELSLAVLRRDTLLCVAVEFIIAGLYINSLLAVLNSRHSIRDTGSTTPSSTSEFTLSKMSFRRTTGQNNGDAGLIATIGPDRPGNVGPVTLCNCGHSSESVTL